MQNKLDLFSEYILANEDYHEIDNQVSYKLPSWVKVVNLLIPKSFNYHSHRYMYQKKIVFYSDSKCNSCGLCEKICSSEKIKLVNGKPSCIVCIPCWARVNVRQ
jgi:NAD-dependent dihydropyrimidine dehydrogenase PreA subunit